MYVRREAEARRHENAPGCVAYEYEMPTCDIDSAVIELTGRYPVKGRAVNTVCTSLVYVIEGSGRLLAGTDIIQLSRGDQVLIEEGDEYAFEGEFRVLFSATPAWSPKQAKIVN